MHAIRDAILSGDRSPETYAALPIPETYRGATVHKDEVDMFEGLRPADKDPRRSLHVDDVPCPSSRPVRRSSPSWRARSTTTPSGPRSSSRCRPSASSSATAGTSPYAQRHDLPYHVVGSDLAGVVLRTGPGVRKWKPGQEVVAHCLSVELEDADGHNDTMLDPAAADLGLRDELRRPRRARHRQGQPADAQADPPDLGGGGGARPGQQHGIPPARSPRTAPR